MKHIAIEFLENLVVARGDVPIHVAMRILRVSSRDLQEVIDKSDILICVDGVIRESPHVESEYGPVREKELRILRETGFPVPSEVVERCREVRTNARSEKVRERKGNKTLDEDCRSFVFPDFEHLRSTIRCSDYRWLDDLQDQIRRYYPCFE